MELACPCNSFGEHQLLLLRVVLRPSAEERGEPCDPTYLNHGAEWDLLHSVYCIASHFGVVCPLLTLIYIHVGKMYVRMPTCNLRGRHVVCAPWDVNSSHDTTSLIMPCYYNSPSMFATPCKHLTEVMECVKSIRQWLILLLTCRHPVVQQCSDFVEFHHSPTTLRVPLL